MTKGWKFLIKIICVPFIIAELHCLLNFHRIQIDGLNGELYCLVNGDDTQYADDFSDRNFTKIKNGMTEKQVKDLLGEPLKIFSYDSLFDKKTFEQGHCIGLKYTDHPSGGTFHLRIIHLDYGKVVKVMAHIDN
ncbi:MAG: hypothetical protein JNJ41_18780 [Bacteroidia bacterium]|nr:hypothetical protein [Bacteroidia bacterium]